MKRSYLLFSFFLVLLTIYSYQPLSAQSGEEGGTPVYDYRIGIGGVIFDPLVEDVLSTSSAGSMQNQDQFNLYFLQLYRPITDVEMAQLAEVVTFVQYIPNYTYLVWARGTAVTSLPQRSPLVRWTGAFPTAFRLGVQVQQLLNEQSEEMVTFEAVLIDEGGLVQLRALIANSDGEIHFEEKQHVMGNFIESSLVHFTVNTDRLSQITALPGLISIAQFELPEIHDEVAANVIAHQDDSDGYRRWLAETGYDGTGVRVAVNDTGIDWEHPDLNVGSGIDRAASYREPNAPGSDGSCVTSPPPGPGDRRPCRGNEPGHGTHVAGIVSGTGASDASDPSGQLFPGSLYGLGIAPGATLHADNVIASGAAWPGYSGMGWSARLANASLSNNSYGVSPGRGYTNTSRSVDTAALDVNSANAVREPFLWIFSAGNSGNGNRSGVCPDGSRIYPCMNSQGAQAEGKNIIAVGSSNSPRSTNPNASTTTISPFSSRGAPLVDGVGRIKPDVVAPGDQIISTENGTVAANGRVGLSCATSPSGSSQHAFCSGTSMAAPQVAGVAALFVDFWREHVGDDSANPEPATVKAALIATTDDLADPDLGGGDDGWGNGLTARPNPHQGWGLVNADRLLNPPVPILFFENPKVFTDTTTSETRNWWLHVRPADTSEPVRITLVWSDAPGAAGAGNPLVNDLSLTVTQDLDLYKGNNFGDDGWSEAGQSLSDSVNNVENVWIERPGDSNLSILVSAVALNGDAYQNNGDATDQHFSLVCYNCIEAFYVDADADDGLLGYWKMDEGSGTTVLDSSGNGHTATVNSLFSWSSSVPSTTRFPNFNSAAIGAPGGAGLVIPYSADLEPQDAMSVALWVRPSIALNGTWHQFFGNPHQPNRARFILHRSPSGDAAFTLYDQNGTKTEVRGGSDPAGQIATGSWTHIAATWHKDGYMRLYVNGKLIDSVDARGVPFGFSHAGLKIGASLFQGNIDEVRLYNRVLKAAEVERLAEGFDCVSDGTSWGSAVPDLQCALTLAETYSTIDEIHVAEGLYPPGTNRRASFSLSHNVHIFGGYANGGGIRDWQRYETILSGDLDHNDSAGADGISGNNAINVVTMNHQSKLSGVIVEHGSADGDGSDWVGGGVFASTDAIIWIEDSIIRDNFASFSGAGLFRNGGSTYVNRSALLGNQGGDMRLQSGSTIWVLNSIIAGTKSAGTLFSTHDNVYFINNTVVGHDRLVEFLSVDRVTMVNNILWDNNSGRRQFALNNVPSTEISHNIVQGGAAGSNNLDADPRFADADGPDNVFGTMDDNVRLRPDSPAIDSGVVQFATCDDPDYLGTPRTLDGDRDGVAGCDRGAYEFGTLLLVDDEYEDFDGRFAYMDALKALGIPYEIAFTQQGDRALSDTFLSSFSEVIWFSGAETLSGPDGGEEAALAAWLDGKGRCFLLSSQNYYADYGLTALMQTHLGVSSVNQNQGYTRVGGSSGSIYGSVSSADLTFPKDFDNLTDEVMPNAGAKRGFSSGAGHRAGVYRESAVYRTTYLGFPLELLPQASVQAILGAFTADCAANFAPVASDDAVDVSSDVASVIIDVLENDWDLDNDTLSITAVTQGRGGKVTHQGTTVSYAPNPNFSGSDSFRYTVNDGKGEIDTATVTVTVDPDPPTTGSFSIYLPLVLGDG